MVAESLHHTVLHPAYHEYHRCKWHAVTQEYAKKYGAKHSHLDGAVCDRAIADLNSALTTAETTVEFEKR